MIEESLNYLRRDDNWVVTVLIGGGLSALGALLNLTFFLAILAIFPGILVMGYLIRVLDRTMIGNDEPPAFDEWADLAVEGAKGTAIAIAYFLVPAIIAGVVAVVGGFSLFGGAASNSSALALAGGLVFLVGGLIALVLGLAAAYVLPAALSNFVEEESLGAAFSFGTLRSVVMTKKYATAWAYGFAIVLGAGIVSGIISAVLGIIPFIGIFIGAIIGAFISFYAGVAAYYIIGTMWGEIHKVTIVDEDEMPDEQPAI